MLRSKNQNMPILVGALRSTLRNLERSEELSPDDPALRGIKRSILHKIASQAMEQTVEVQPEQEDMPEKNQHAA